MALIPEFLLYFHFTQPFGCVLNDYIPKISLIVFALGDVLMRQRFLRTIVLLKSKSFATKKKIGIGYTLCSADRS